MKKFWQRYRFALPDNSEYSMMLQKGSESFILPLNKKHKKDSYFISIAIGYLIGFFLPKCGYWHQHACCRHVHDGVANQDASIGITNSLTTSGNLRGVRLRMVNSDFLISNQENTGQINLSTNFNTRMTIEASGKVGINTIASTMSLHVTALNKYGIYSTATENGTDTIAGIFNKALSPAPVPYNAGVRGESNSTDQNGIGVLGVHTGFGRGVAGFVKELGSFTYGSGVYGAAGSPLSGFGNGGYGVQGVNNNINGVAGFFQNNSGSGGSRALVIYGAVQLINLNEGAGKVLTSDIAGNATWQNLPPGTGAWTITGNDIQNSNSGNVGIGTALPNYKLHVKDDLFVQSSHGRIILGYDGGNQWNLATINGGADICLGTYNDGGTTEAYSHYFKQNGDVGIGNIDALGPKARLDVIGIGNTSNTMLLRNSLGDTFFKVQDGGNVGIRIGTAAPAARLDVKTSPNYVAQFNGGTAMYMGLFKNNLYRGYFGSFSGNAEDVDFGTGNGNISGKVHLTIQGSPKLTVDNFGNLGIGTTTPGEKLEINNGFMKATGLNRTAFTITTFVTNTSGNNTLIHYINPISTDLIIVTHNWQGNYMSSIGVYFTAGTWRLFREDQVGIPIGKKFNVMNIK